jgi:hypothetical protein
MTTTLTEDTTYSTLMIMSYDTIDLAGYVLTIDSQPYESGIVITSPGTAGSVTLSGGYDLSTWSMTAGTGVLIATIPSDTELDSLTGGSATSAYGCTDNYGTITTCTGGSGTNARGCNSNYGTITTCTGGTGTNAYGCNANYSSGGLIPSIGIITTCSGGSVANSLGCNANYGTITTCTGGAGTNAHGCWISYKTITTCTGGSGASYGCRTSFGKITTCTGGTGTNAFGCWANQGLVTTAVGGSGTTAYGIGFNYSYVLNLTDTTRLAVGSWYSQTVFVLGPGIVGEIKAPVATIYSLGAMNAGATLPGGATVITMSEGAGGGGLMKIGQGGGYNG